MGYSELFLLAGSEGVEVHISNKALQSTAQVYHIFNALLLSPAHYVLRCRRTAQIDSRTVHRRVTQQPFQFAHTSTGTLAPWKISCKRAITVGTSLMRNSMGSM